MIKVTNAPFFRDAEKTVSKKALTRNCLCKKHNELLSPYDSEAISFGHALIYCRDLVNSRTTLSAKKFAIHKKIICYEKLSRWAIKTYLGVADFFRYESNCETEFLANLVYSKTPSRNYVKIDFLMSQDDELQITQTVAIAPIEKNEKSVGMMIEMYGIQLTVIFADEPIFDQKQLRLNFMQGRKVKSCELVIK
tara:strand:- start:598 stop:1179 length:582 start_codon:yes stop_codon:yes gene_type:complete